MNLPAVLTPEEINTLPIRRWEGEVALVEDEPALARAMADLRAERVAGFDTETRPAFRPGESYSPSLVQLATARAVYLFPLARADFAAQIGELMGASRLAKAGVGTGDDLRQLRKLYSFSEQSVVDLGAAARKLGLKQSGVRYLAAAFLGFRIPKGAKTSNWAAKRLSAQQVAYAATDAWACRELYLKFEALGFL